jgi:hypothetical protein
VIFLLILIGLIIGALLGSERLMQCAMVFGAALWGAFVIGATTTRDYVVIRRVNIRRDENPVQYWGIVVVDFALLVLLILAGIYAAVRESVG